MNLQKVRYFIALADHGSIAKAAEARNVSRFSISQAVRDLEAEIGEALVVRHKRGITLTDAGRLALQAMRQAAQAVDRIVPVARRHDGPTQLRVAVASGILSVLSEWFGRLTRETPGLIIRTLGAHGEDGIASLVRGGDVDIGLGHIDHAHRDLRLVALAPIDMVLLSPTGTCLPKEVAFADLKDIRLILPSSGLASRAAIDRAFDSAGIRPDIVFETDDASAFIPAVRAGLGSALFWRQACGGVDDIEIRAFTPPWRFPLGCVYRPDAPTLVGAVVRKLAGTVRSN